MKHGMCCTERKEVVVQPAVGKQGAVVAAAQDGR